MFSSKLNRWQKTDGSFQVGGMRPSWWAFMIRSHLEERNQLLVCRDEEEAEQLYLSCRHLFSGHECVLYPGLESSPYSGVLAQEKDFHTRLSLLNRLVKNDSHLVVICSLESLILRMPPRSFFEDNFLEIKTNHVFPREDLANSLVNLGYSHSVIVEEEGSFSQKGEIFDIHPIGRDPVRLHYFDDTIEEIFHIDPASNRTNRNSSVQEIHVTMGGLIFTRKDLVSSFRGNLSRLPLQSKQMTDWRREILKDFSQGRLCRNYIILIPLFFDRTETLLDFFDEDAWIHFFDNISLESKELKQALDEDYSSKKNFLFIPPQNLYHFDYREKCSHRWCFQVDQNEKNSLFHMNFHLESLKNSKFHEGSHSLSGIVNKASEDKARIFFTCESDAEKQEALMVFDENKWPSFEFFKSSLNEGFYWEKEKILLITQNDLFHRGRRKRQRSTRQKIDLFAEQLTTLEKDDFIMHKFHGLGRFLGLSSMDTDGIKTDYLIIGYQKGDKIYVPVYKMDLIQKHAGKDAGLSLADLRSAKYTMAKERAKQAVKKLAFDLIQLQAERQLGSAHAFSPPDRLFTQFERSFPFDETVDQILAVEDVLKDMQKKNSYGSSHLRGCGSG